MARLQVRLAQEEEALGLIALGLLVARELLTGRLRECAQLVRVVGLRSGGSLLPLLVYAVLGLGLGLG